VRLTGEDMKMRAVAVCLAVLALAGGALYAREEQRQDQPKVEELLKAPLAGEPGREVDIRIYTFAPGTLLPWHVHPGAHEFVYQLEGTLTLEIEGQPTRDVKAGEAVYVPPNVVHRGSNRSATAAAKLHVVRVKPKDKPLAEDVPR
jgi:quercetin dioxygenase-like cupin family protein